MAAQRMEQSECTTPPPTPEELSTILKLQTENINLLEKRKCYLGLFNVLYSELELALTTEAQIRKENARLRAELLSLGASQDFDSSKGHEPEHTLHEAVVKSIEEFLLHLLKRAQSASSEGFSDKDLPPNFPSLTRFSDPQPSKGAEVPDLRSSVEGCRFPSSTPNQQPTALISELGGDIAFQVAGTPGIQSTTTTCHSCNTSQLFEHQIPAQPMSIANNPQNLEPHVIEMSGQRHVPRPVSTLPVFPEMLPEPTAGGVPQQALSQTTLPTNTLMHHNCAQATTAYESMVPGNALQNEEANDLLSLERARCKVPPLQNEFEAHNSLSPTDLQQARCSNSISCLPACVTTGSPPLVVSGQGSRFSTPMVESNSASAEDLFTSRSDQPKRATFELSSTASSTGVVSQPIPHGVTTLVVRNVPARYTKEMLMQEWPPNGTYDFLYLPFNFKQKRTAGFVYVNCTSHEAAVNFYSQWHGKSLRDQGTSKRLTIGVAEAQGLEANLRHVAASNISRIKNPKHMPSVFDGIDEVPLAGLLDQITNTSISDSTRGR